MAEEGCGRRTGAGEGGRAWRGDPAGCREEECRQWEDDGRGKVRAEEGRWQRRGAAGMGAEEEGCCGDGKRVTDKLNAYQSPFQEAEREGFEPSKR